jgi:hypothetical protein
VSITARVVAVAAGIALTLTTTTAVHGTPTASAMPAATANAAPARLGSESVLKDPPCNRGEVCLYFHNALVTKIPPVSPGDCFSLNRSYDYIRNLSDVAQRAWSGNFCEGVSVTVIPGTSTHLSFYWSVGGWP